MKKSLVALAILAASGASFAQSNVTLYGLADAWFGSTKNENNDASFAAGAGTGSIKQTKIDSGGVNSSRWGLKGSEDLGGGLKAIFKLEQQFSIDNGAQTAGQAFSREAYVGLAGGFGEVKLGKVWTAFDDVSGSSNGAFDANIFAPANTVFASNQYQANPGNTVYYASPSMGGISGAASYSLGEDKTATTDASSITSLNVVYAAGPVAAQFGYQVENIDNLTATSADAKFLRLGGSFDFGVAVAKASYGSVANVNGVSDRDAKEYQIGVDFPVSPALVLSGSYAKSDDSNDDGSFEQTRKGFGIAAKYSLSKRTFVYGGYESDKTTNEAAEDSKHSVFAVGVQHRF